VILLDDALQIVEGTGERWFAAELYRHKGQLLLRQGHPEAAEELYRRALSIAREQQAKMWELRAAVSLARIRRDQGRPAEARDLLAPVSGWFTEGFGMPDLKEAKSLLGELRDPATGMCRKFGTNVRFLAGSTAYGSGPGMSQNGRSAQQPPASNRRC
jgi:predicted ATPase